VSGREPEVAVHTADPDRRAVVRDGHVRCRAFPFVIITSNAEREFPPAFLRRCLRFEMRDPDEDQLANIVAAHFTDDAGDQVREMISDFLEYRRVHGGLATDQLLNAVYLVTAGADTASASWHHLLDLVWQRLNQGEGVGA
jgi:MoxR-like ATPase